MLHLGRLTAVHDHPCSYVLQRGSGHSPLNRSSKIEDSSKSNVLLLASRKRIEGAHEVKKSGELALVLLVELYAKVHDAITDLAHPL